MLTVTLALVGIGIVLAVLAAEGKPTLWASVLCLYLLALLQLLPR